MTQINNEQQWKLEDINIRFNDWGDYKDKYTGKVKFSNNKNEAFIFTLTPERCAQYLHLIKEEVCGAADKLGERLIQSLNLLPAPAEKKELGEAISHEEVTI